MALLIEPFFERPIKKFVVMVIQWYASVYVKHFNSSTFAADKQNQPPNESEKILAERAKGYGEWELEDLNASSKIIIIITWDSCRNCKSNYKVYTLISMEKRKLRSRESMATWKNERPQSIPEDHVEHPTKSWGKVVEDEWAAECFF